MIQTVLALLIALPILLLVAGQLGLLKGQAPRDLGVRDGRLKALSSTANCVSSQASLFEQHPQRGYAHIEPLSFKRGDASASIAALLSTLHSLPGVTVVEQRPDYLYVQSQTRWLKFVDDMEFWANPATQVIEVRSASRLGRKDFGKNRAQVEAVRAAYGAAN